MANQLAFIFIGPEVDKEKSRSSFRFADNILHVAGVCTYDEAVETAVEFANGGVTCIELCAGFGNEGTAAVAKAVAGKAITGVVRFDLHPAFGHRSGDEVFTR